MLNLKIWKAKRLVNKIEDYQYKKLPKFENYVKKIKSWIKQDTKELNKLLKEMTIEEYEQFRERAGY